MSQEFVNVRIRRSPSPDPNSPGRPLRKRLWLLDHEETYKGGRALEPQDVLRLPAAQAKQFLQEHPYFLEVTTEEANRDLYIKGDWKASSMYYPSEDNEELQKNRKMEEEANRQIRDPEAVQAAFNLNADLQLQVANLSNQMAMINKVLANLSPEVKAAIKEAMPASGAVPAPAPELVKKESAKDEGVKQPAPEDEGLGTGIEGFDVNFLDAGAGTESIDHLIKDQAEEGV